MARDEELSMEELDAVSGGLSREEAAEWYMANKDEIKSQLIAKGKERVYQKIKEDMGLVGYMAGDLESLQEMVKQAGVVLKENITNKFL